MIIACAFTAMHSFMENYFYIENKTKTLLMISTTKLVVFLIFSFILVPAYNLLGLVYAQLIAAIIALTITVSSMNLHKKVKLRNLLVEDELEELGQKLS
jgi:O-antigen/teichoic acid export membrane protein